MSYGPLGYPNISAHRRIASTSARLRWVIISFVGRNNASLAATLELCRVKSSSVFEAIIYYPVRNLLIDPGFHLNSRYTEIIVKI